MKYRTIEGGYKVPVFTKEWKAMWFMLGMFFQIFAPFMPLSIMLSGFRKSRR